MNILLSKILSQPIQNDRLLKNINCIRSRLASIDDVQVLAYGPKNPKDTDPVPESIRVSGKSLKVASSDYTFGVLLFKLAAFVSQNSNGEARVVELGTCVGISTMYLLAGLSAARGGVLYTFEGSPELAAIAEQNISHFSEINKVNKNIEVEVIVGPFSTTVTRELDRVAGKSHLAFIDGNHLEKATLEYHLDFSKRMNDDYIIIHDDINFNQGMERAWHSIVESEGEGRCVELLRGFSPAKGLVLRQNAPSGRVQKIHIDDPTTRILRYLKQLA